ncbi:probable ATP-dependent DNA helicase HFM1 [Trichonephila inaurata madagascariensis]|uniref:DNA 3'-5' helicase n=1 Tax=Trichonephila inaurata madagascariensis TaxID=2747483 RepID=A0A8X7CMZ4_9ARAC|nr:probable ATP-dependent DNA helicase HFM1 [Trichonephila inaurata madagascariensis]
MTRVCVEAHGDEVFSDGHRYTRDLLWSEQIRMFGEWKTTRGKQVTHIPISYCIIPLREELCKTGRTRLHKHIVEHLNAEIVLGTITDISIAMEWLKATFLYQRIFKNPKHYGINMELSKEKIERKLQDTGRLMARHYLAFETMKSFSTLTGSENFSELLALVSSCKEFEDIQLRVNEKKFLNDLNKSKSTSIRLGGVFDIRHQRFLRPLSRHCARQVLQGSSLGELQARVQAAGKNSMFPTGVTLSTVLVNAGITSFESLGSTNPRELELILNRNPPFGSILVDNVKHLPQYEIQVEQSFVGKNECVVVYITVLLKNFKDLEERRTTFDNHGCTLLVGNADNDIILFKKIRVNSRDFIVLFLYEWKSDHNVAVAARNINAAFRDGSINEQTYHSTLECNIRIWDAQLLEMGHWSRKVDVPKAQRGNQLHIHWISDSYEELSAELQDSNDSEIVEIRRFINSGTCPEVSPILIIILGTVLPDNVKLWFINHKIQLFIDRPRRCFNCFSFSPLSRFCPSPAISCLGGSSHDNKLKDFPKHNQVENMGSEMRSCYHKCLNKAICAHFCCKAGIQVSAAQRKRTQIENFMDQLQSKMNVFPSKKIKLEGARKGTATPRPSSKWNDPHFVDEDWFQDANEDDLFMEQEPTEKEVKSEVFSFDINLASAMEEDELQDIETNAKEDKDKTDAPAKSISDSPPTIQQEVWSK